MLPKSDPASSEVFDKLMDLVNHQRRSIEWERNANKSLRFTIRGLVQLTMANGHPPINILLEPIGTLELFVSQESELQKNNIQCIGDLIQKTPKALKDIGFKPKAIRLIKEALDEYGFTLGTQLSENWKDG